MYEVKRIEKACAAAGRVANGTAASTSTAKPTPKKRGRKPKAVPYLKRVRLEREEKERVAAAFRQDGSPLAANSVATLPLDIEI